MVELTTYLKLPSYGQHLGLIPVMKGQLKKLCKLQLDGKKACKLMVFVDDLDRCGPKGIMETLEAIRLVMNMDNVIVVIALDHRIALRAIAAHYAKHYEKLGKEFFQDLQLHRIARDYLGKIVQLPIRLSRLAEPHMRKFISELFAVEDRLPKATNGKRPDDTATESEKPLDKGGDVAAAAYPESSTDVAGAFVDAPDESPKIEVSDAVETQKRVASILEDIGQDTSDERDLFADLTTEYGFANPRQLKRLSNAYRLLRTLDELAAIDGAHVPARAPQRNMTMLFWLDFVYESNRDQARAAVRYLLKSNLSMEDQLMMEGLRLDLEPKVTEMRRLFVIDTDQGLDYRRTAGRVRRLILPHFSETTTGWEVDD